MGRIIGYIIAIIISIVFERITPRRYRYNFRNNEFYPVRRTLADTLRLFIRRNRALSIAKPYIKRKKHFITLKNKNVLLIYNTKEKIITLLDVKNMKRTAKVIWEVQTQSLKNIREATKNPEIEQTFDYICQIFNDNSNYLGILNLLKMRFSTIEETTGEPEQKKESAKISTQKEEKVNTEKINLNDMSEDELSKLPGISIVQAKRIIDRINYKGEFNSPEEFYEEFKIKPHFKNQLNDLICTKPTEHKPIQQYDRIIDI